MHSYIGVVEFIYNYNVLLYPYGTVLIIYLEVNKIIPTILELKVFYS